MIPSRVILLTCALGGALHPACAEPPPEAADRDFDAALSQAYLTNPQLLAQRARLRQTDEDVPRALSGWRPRVTLDGNAGASAVFDSIDTAHRPERRLPQQAELSLTQPIYTGGRVRAQVAQAEALVAAERAGLQATEAQVLLAAATVYLDVVRDQSIVALNRHQATVLERTLRATRQQADTGAATEADVAQTRARVADQQAMLATAVAALDASRADYEQAIGTSPGVLALPTAVPPLAGDLQAALTLVPKNFDVLQSRAAQDASRRGIDIARAGLRPRLSFQIYGARVAETDVQLAHQHDTIAEATVQLTIPIYQGGQDAADIRQAKEAASVSLLQADAVLHQARAQVQTAWAQLAGARTRIAQYEASLDANMVAQRGIERQQSVGQRTLIEVLNAEQETLAAEVNLVSARHDAQIAGLRLQAVTGQLSAAALKLDVPIYDPARHYLDTRDRWFGTDPAP